MSIVNVCPEIPDNWRGGMSETSRVLGLSRDTLRKYAELGKRNGGIGCTLSRSGKRLFIGKEIKRFWNEH